MGKRLPIGLPARRRILRGASCFLAVAMLAAVEEPVAGQTVLGHVQREDLSGPFAGARVRLLTADLTPLDSARTDALGLFSFSLPAPGAYVLVAEAAGFSGDSRAFEIAGRGTREVLLRLRPVPGSSVALRTAEDPRENVDVLGRVMDREKLRPIQGAEVRLIGREGSVVTNGHGRFLLLDQAPGVVVVRVEHIGYAAREDTLELEPGWAFALTIRLDEEAVPLEGFDVTVASRPSARRMRGVYERIDRGMGGHTLLGEELERSGFPSLAEAVGRMPSVRLQRTAGALFRVRIRGASGGGCSPALFIDGVLVQRPDDPPDPIWTLRTMDVEVIEMYPGPATLPGEFARSGVECAVGVWTRRGG